MNLNLRTGVSRVRLEDVDQLKVTELRSQLKAIGLSFTGIKQELVERLKAALVNGDSKKVEPLHPNTSAPIISQSQISTSVSLPGVLDSGRTETHRENDTLMIEHGGVDENEVERDVEMETDRPVQRQVSRGDGSRNRYPSGRGGAGRGRFGGNGEKEPSRVPRTPVTALRISGLKRPFVVSELKEHLARIGGLSAEEKLPFFWISSRRDHCFVEYPSSMNATSASKNLTRSPWPPENVKRLSVYYISAYEAQDRAKNLGRREKAVAESLKEERERRMDVFRQYATRTAEASHRQQRGYNRYRDSSTWRKFRRNRREDGRRHYNRRNRSRDSRSPPVSRQRRKSRRRRY